MTRSGATPSQQVVAGDVGIGQIDVGGMVDDPAIGLFRHALVKAPVAGFHVKNWYFAPLGRDNRQAAVGVAQHQQGVGVLGRQHFVHGDDDLTNGLGRRAAGGVQEMVGLADFQVPEEDLVQFIVIVLTGMDEDLVHLLIQPGDDAR